MSSSTIQVTNTPLPSIPVAMQTFGGKIYQQVVSGIVNVPHDYISLSYTGSNLTGVIFKTGGSGGTTTATLILGYSGSNLISVTRS